MDESESLCKWRFTDASSDNAYHEGSDDRKTQVLRSGVRRRQEDACAFAWHRDAETLREI